MPAGSSLGASVAAQRDIHSDSATSEAPAVLDQVLTWTILIKLSQGSCLRMYTSPLSCVMKKVSVPAPLRLLCLQTMLMSCCSM